MDCDPSADRLYRITSSRAMTDFLKNPFLVLAVSSDASMAEIKKVSDRTLMEMRLHGEESSPRARAIERAMEELRDPLKRFKWGLFWPELSPSESEPFRLNPILSQFGEDPGQPAAEEYKKLCSTDSRIVKSHNLGSLKLIEAVAKTREAQLGTPDDISDDLACSRLWEEAFGHLTIVVESEEFWMRQKMRAKSIDDPRLDDTYIQMCRQNYLSEVLEHVGKVIQTALLDGHAKVASAYVDTLWKTDFDDSFIDSTLSNVYKPLADRIEQNIESISDKLNRLKKNSSHIGDFKKLLMEFEAEVHSDLSVMLEVGDLPGYAEEHARDTAAEFLRSLGVASWNATGESEVAKETSRLAEKFADSDALRSRVREDQSTIQQIENSANVHDLVLEIRSDRITIDRSGIRYKDRHIASEDLWGIAYGVFKQYTNGVQSSCSYLVKYKSRRGGVIVIECKRMLRSDTKAMADFQAILSSTLHQLAPSLVSRIADAVVSGQQHDMGDGCLLTKSGVQFSSGMLMWKRENIIPYRDVRYSSDKGTLVIASSRDHKAKVGLTLRVAWNAVLFEHIVQAILERQ